MTDAHERSQLFDDNPAVQDLLGFSAIADAIVRVVTAGGLDPVTVGIQGAWGGGKSTVLNLVAEQLKDMGHVLVVRVDPWEFEDNEDVRGTLIALVLNALQTQITKEDVVEPGRKEKVLSKLDDLRRRIAWGRVARVLVTSAVTMTPKIVDLVDALTPAPPVAGGDADPDKPQSMAGFREDFQDLMSQDLGLTKVVVLVDDLDRCLPPAVVATLEAIKLFLSVKKMAFVLAADEDLVRASIDAHLGGLANGDFAARYTEKIVQLPIALPVLSVHDAEAYIGLLLSSGVMTGEELRATVERASQRRRSGQAPYLVADEHGAVSPSVADLNLAAAVATGLSADLWQTPRAVKRFLNNLAIRQHISIGAGAELPLPVLVRMYVLELRHLAEFKRLAQMDPDERKSFLHAWEEWGHHVEGATQPEGVDERTREWAGTLPRIAEESVAIDRYLSLAATLVTDVRFAGAMNSTQRALVERLLHESDTTRRTTVEDVLHLDGAQQDAVVHAIGDQLGRMQDPEIAIESLTRLQTNEPRLRPAVVSILQRPSVLRQIEVHHVPLLEALPEVLQSIVTTDGVDSLAVAAAKAAIEG